MAIIIGTPVVMLLLRLYQRGADLMFIIGWFWGWI